MPKRIRIGDGAEGVVYREGELVIKVRPRKRYRLETIDMTLRKTRTRVEAKILKKLSSIGFPVPKLISSDDKTMEVNMDFLDGTLLKKTLGEGTQVRALGEKIGVLIAKMHAVNIIHGDLTTSNMMLVDNKIFFIDFGLGFFSTKLEDRAVDLHLLRRAVNGHHPLIAKEFCFPPHIPICKNPLEFRIGPSYKQTGDSMKR